MPAGACCAWKRRRCVPEGLARTPGDEAGCCRHGQRFPACQAVALHVGDPWGCMLQAASPVRGHSAQQASVVVRTAAGQTVQVGDSASHLSLAVGPPTDSVLTAPAGSQE